MIHLFGKFVACLVDFKSTLPSQRDPPDNALDLSELSEHPLQQHRNKT